MAHSRFSPAHLSGCPLATAPELPSSASSDAAIDADDQHETLTKHVYIPQELLDSIIDCLHDDSESLRACALTARSWRPRSQTHIHHTLKVTCRWQCTQAENVYSDPALASCIRELHIQDLSLKRYGDREHWVDQCVPAMLSKLNQDHPLAIESVIIQNGHDIEWGSHPDPFFPNVTKLTVRRLNFRVGAEFTSFMRHFPRVSSLTLDDFTIAYRTRDIAAPGPRPPLRDLEICSSPGQEFFMNWFLHQSPEDIQLQSFVYPIERWQVRAPKPSLKALGASVKDLTIVFAFASPHYLLKGDPLLPHLSSLRNLTFDHTTLFGTLYGPPSIPVLLKEISAAHVSTVRFRFMLDNQYTPLEQSVEKLERINLGHADTILDDLQPFHELQDVTVQICSRDWAKLMRLPDADDWIAADTEQRRVFSEKYCVTSRRPTDLSALRASSPERDHHPDPEVERVHREAELSLERGNIRRARSDYEKARDTWDQATSVVQKALPTMASRNMLRIEPLDDAAPERLSSQPRYYNAYQYERAHRVLFQ
ncbi:uncharacterized protein B0H18DRAFT_1122761 [Fomitopsis serialis]|uniref:uncharacterized protein n=1 Tax=Fomitopsis serialis TaxID=139415 RepID=UPI0020089AC0|nr:uncharacterized protein B0H18DRAFT_1122761 [Neoantrodia serialis]KAH9918953.1 hypothetical protein B0H18DRAFT_1122761 [Neoantrodia serialis]